MLRLVLSTTHILPIIILFFLHNATLTILLHIRVTKRYKQFLSRQNIFSQQSFSRDTTTVCLSVCRCSSGMGMSHSSRASRGDSPLRRATRYSSSRLYRAASTRAIRSCLRRFLKIHISRIWSVRESSFSVATYGVTPDIRIYHAAMILLAPEIIHIFFRHFRMWIKWLILRWQRFLFSA